MLKDIRGSSRPRDLSAVKTRIQSRIGQQSEPDKVACVIARLETLDVIEVLDGTLNYLEAAEEFKAG